MAEPSNDELLSELRSGNQKAFDIIFRRYFKLLCYEARGYFRNNSLVEEIVCDVFTKIWIKRDTLAIDLSLREYLIKSVHNNCINYYRMQKTQEKLKQDVEANYKKTSSLFDIGQDPLEYTISNELTKNILEAIESLPNRYKQAFKLSRFKGLTYEEIALEMGITIDGVKMNIKKALGQLRVKLSEYLLLILVMLSISAVSILY